MLTLIPFHFKSLEARKRGETTVQWVNFGPKDAPQQIETLAHFGQSLELPETLSRKLLSVFQCRVQLRFLLTTGLAYCLCAGCRTGVYRNVRSANRHMLT